VGVLEGESLLLCLEYNFSLTYTYLYCPENVASYIHQVGRNSHYESDGKSVLFLLPSETQMLEKLKERKV
jgi:superfamily II DNA/RNA helicase